jgi:hypothetical protein
LTRINQILEEIDVGPVPVGVNSFLFESSTSVDISKIPREDVIGVTGDV